MQTSHLGGNPARERRSAISSPILRWGLSLRSMEKRDVFSCARALVREIFRQSRNMPRELGPRKGFFQYSHRIIPVLFFKSRSIPIGLGSKINGFDVGVMRTYLGDHLETIFEGHTNVGNHNIRSKQQKTEVTLISIARRSHLVAILFQCYLDDRG